MPSIGQRRQHKACSRQVVASRVRCAAGQGYNGAAHAVATTVRTLTHKET
jgi:hypothetical protein